MHVTCETMSESSSCFHAAHDHLGAVAVIQAPVELGVPKLVELGRTSQKFQEMCGKNAWSAVANTAIEAPGKIHHTEAKPAATRQEILNSFMACLEVKRP